MNLYLVFTAYLFNSIKNSIKLIKCLSEKSSVCITNLLYVKESVLSLNKWHYKFQ